MKNSVTARIRKQEREWLNDMAKKCSLIEGRRVSTAEILQRIKSGEDIEARLIKGSYRRAGL